jgi:hypothetical protein
MSASKKPGAGAKRGRATERAKPLYSRGEGAAKYSLYETASRGYQIVFYDPVAKRERYKAGTKDLAVAMATLDKLYCGHGICQYCGAIADKGEDADNDNIVRIVNDYWSVHGSEQLSAAGIKSRLDHVLRYIGDKPVRVGNVTETWIKDYRAWLAKDAYFNGKGEAGGAKYRSASTIENSILQLQAAIRWAKKTPLFKVKVIKDLSRSPAFRADIPLIAAMFRYALAGGKKRENLLQFLRFSVVTLARPEAALEASTAPQRKQWAPTARVFSLNPIGRSQTKKYRATVPVPECIGEWLDSIPKGPIVANGLSTATWKRMEIALGLPGEGESGMKLIRRSVATILRKRLGEANWIQGRMMLGHVQPSTSDIYAIADPTYLGEALAVTSAIIAEIEGLTPGAFSSVAGVPYRNHTATEDNVVSIAA